MKVGIDFKSLVLGLIAGVGLTALIGTADSGESGATGRYQITAVQDYAFVLDTGTGKVWTTRLGDDGPSSYFGEPK